MSEIPVDDTESIDPFRVDYETSKHTLERIHKQHFKQLANAGFMISFIDAMKNVPDLSHQEDVYVAQILGETREIHAVLRRRLSTGEVDEGSKLITRQIGEVREGIRMPYGPFGFDDMDIAVEQLDRLQEMKDVGMIMLDSSLSWPVQPPKTI